MNRKVNLLILGTQKAGTTSLYEYIRQHTNIYFSDVKEVTYFVNDELYRLGEDYYHSFFSRVKSEEIIASAYVHMLPCRKCPERVRDYNPDMKFIIMLREPVDRAYSAYNYAIKNGWEDIRNSFEDTLFLEKERLKEEKYDLTYFENGKYHKHIKHWMSFFPKENFLLIKDTELKGSPKEVLEKIFSFLGIENQANSIDTSREYNKAGVVRSKRLQAFLLNKNSKIKKIVGTLLPREYKVWIRANILKKIYSINQIDKENRKLPLSSRRKIEKVFEQHNSNLRKEFGIVF